MTKDLNEGHFFFDVSDVRFPTVRCSPLLPADWKRGYESESSLRHSSLSKTAIFAEAFDAKLPERERARIAASWSEGRVSGYMRDIGLICPIYFFRLFKWMIVKTSVDKEEAETKLECQVKVSRRGLEESVLTDGRSMDHDG